MTNFNIFTKTIKRHFATLEIKFKFKLIEAVFMSTKLKFFCIQKFNAYIFFIKNISYN